MIVVVGRPGLDATDNLDGLAGLIAVAAARAGARVELVGSVGDDPAGERVALALGEAGIRHAALLRDPAAVTQRADGPSGPRPRLDRQDIELGLAYLADYGVLVVAESLDPPVLRAAVSAAEFQRASLIVVVAQAGEAPAELPITATVVEAPAEGDSRFAELIGRYAAALDGGDAPADAWRRATSEAGWEPTRGG